MSDLGTLLVQLDVAVRSHDRPLVIELARRILQAIARESGEHAALERRINALLGEWEKPVPMIQRRGSETFPAERAAGGTGMAGEDIVYPVWFGTNRKPDGRGGFGSERNDQIIRGRAEVLIPESHRFGETRSSFWKRLLRFDLRDDTLRLQRIVTKERSD